MTDTAFQITLDAAAHRMQVIVVGMWTIEIVVAYEAAIDREMDRFRRAGGRAGALDILIDLSRGAVLPADVAERLKQASQHYLPMARRVAVFSPHSAIKRLAARRIASTSKQLICADMDEALAWLAEPDAALKATG